jgi:hypothetical protein
MRLMVWTPYLRRALKIVSKIFLPNFVFHKKGIMFYLAAGCIDIPCIEADV